MISDSGSEIDEEFLEIFLEESCEVLQNLKKFVHEFKDTTDIHLFENYGQQIDRIMGTAFTLSLNFVGEMTKMGKEIAYKSLQVHETSKLLSIHGLLSQLLKALEKMMKSMKNGDQPIFEEFIPLLDRLKTANQDLGKIWSSLS